MVEGRTHIILEPFSSVPRLTSRLRALSEERDSASYFEKLFADRARKLEERRQERKDLAPGRGYSGIRDELITATIGSWKGSTKPAKSAFEAYIHGIGSLLLGDQQPTTDAVAEVALAVWKALCHVSPPTEDEIKRKGVDTAALEPVVAALESVLGAQLTPDNSTVRGIWKLFRDLQHFIPAKFTSDMVKQMSGEDGAAIQREHERRLTDACATPSAIQSLTQEQLILAACGLDTGHPAAALILQQQGKSIQAFPTLELRQPAPEFSAEAVAAVEVEVFGGNKGFELNKEAGARWLSTWCSHSGMGPISSQESANTDDDSMSTAVALLVLDPGVSDDALASQLFDLLGEGVFDRIVPLLEQRAALTANIRAAIAAHREEEAAESSALRAVGPSYGTSVTVMSESERLAMRAERKAERRRAKENAREETTVGHSSGDVDLDWLSKKGLRLLVEEEIEREESHMKIKLGNGMEFRLGEGVGAKGALPKGTTRTAFKGYEEVHVPAVAPAKPPPGERIVTIAELPDWSQATFVGYTSLNRIQSRIFPTAFGSNENMLVCAPTGAGKTNIAMLSILREISQHMHGDSIARSEFKVVYVAPMKALAAEVTAGFAKRLAPLGLSVRELTGDMQLSKREMAETQMIVTTPEKWDVITRKGGEVSVAASVRLLIIDEVHLLNDERGPVIETLVARTTRQVETSQSMIRIVGLSATLPNYRDIATFLGVNHDTGLFYFDASYRPVPLETTFVGVSERNFLARSSLMDEICYQKVVESIKRGHQAMVFVHSRKDTGKTARMLVLKAQQSGESALFDCSMDPHFPAASKDAKKSRNREVSELVDSGVGLHHAGMLRSDRTLMERLFGAGLIKVLCCTATLAWGVNLPAHTVIIKGTQLYNPQKGGFTDLGMLDVQQIFGRAGRPQFQDSGEAAILTTHDKLAHYLSMLTHAVPIESQFTAGLADHLNAEIVLGTVTTVKEAIAWLGYTYLYVRMSQNPLVYGIRWEELAGDPTLQSHRRKLVTEAARELERSKMARFDERAGNLYVTELGRVASHFYIRQATIETWNEAVKPHMTEADLLSAIARASEFENLAVRDDELLELDELARGACPHEPRGGSENKHGKANILLQAYVSRAKVDSFSLVADLNYVAQNAPRLARALFEICLRQGWPSAASLCLSIAKAFEQRLWPHLHPLWQFENLGLKHDLIRKLEERHFDLDQLREMSDSDIGAALRHPAAGSQIGMAVRAFPALGIATHLHPITRAVLRIQLDITPEFQWRDAVHGAALRWQIWVEDSDNERTYHTETWTLTKRMWKEGTQRLTFAVPIFEPLPPQYYVRVVSDSFLGAETLATMSFKGLLLPERHPPHTELLDLDPLPITALGNPQLSSLYRFSHFNPIQTQTFHVLYHSDENVLLGAPTGSGKTVSAELAMMRLFSAHPGSKAVYIAPLKALVRERIKDWSRGFCATLGKRLVELTGDFTPDMKALVTADIIIATPEKWDGISRAWQDRSYVRQVGLVIMDEIHLLGADRGPILEVIVSRMRYVAAASGAPMRFVGLSTALSNAVDLADWLGVSSKGLFNFKPSVRPVPLECHIQGYPGKFYCPRMATMNKPAYAAIQTHSPMKPVLVFVSSRRQTRLTALDLIAYAAQDMRPRAFLRSSDDEEMEVIVQSIKDASLRHTLQFGVGLHHAGLTEDDRATVERLFVESKIQVLVATSTLAWGVNTPAHLVIIKGTEYYDAPSKRYVDYPITDVLQMMGRAGRPQYDHHGVAVVMVYEPKKSFYKKFLYEPFPVESSLPAQLADHLNAEVAAGTIKSRQDALDYLTWTFFLRRLVQNPSYYGLESTEPEAVSIFLSEMVGEALGQLEAAGCIAVKGGEEGTLMGTTPGRIASFFYLQYTTMAVFAKELRPGMQVQEVLHTLCAAAEYDELPVRHNEDALNAGMVGQVRFPPDIKTVDDPHTKASLLLQAHLSRLPLPISDYVTDTKSVLDNSLRILQAIVDVCADAGWADTVAAAQMLVQALTQARWHDEDPRLMLPGLEHASLRGNGKLDKFGSTLEELVTAHSRDPGGVAQVLAGDLRQALVVLERLPAVNISVEVAPKEGSGDRLVLAVNLERTHGKAANGVPPRVYAPRFPKIKEEGWWLMAIDAVDGSNDVLAMKRVSFGRAAHPKLVIPAKSSARGAPLTTVTVRLVSDAYLGMSFSRIVDITIFI